jgi:putative tricarboxylic transport membrane protein
VRRSLACAGAGLALAAAYWLAADALPRSALADEVGADGVPKLLAIVLAALSLLIGFSRDAERPPASPKSLGVAGLGFLYVAIVSFTGYLVAASLLAAAAAYYYGARGRSVLPFAVATALLLWAVFAKALGVALP